MPLGSIPGTPPPKKDHPRAGETICQSYTSLIRMPGQPGKVAHACNPSTWEAETGGSGFAASLSYLVRPSAT